MGGWSIQLLDIMYLQDNSKRTDFIERSTGPLTIGGLLER